MIRDRFGVAVLSWPAADPVRELAVASPFFTGTKIRMRYEEARLLEPATCFLAPSIGSLSETVGQPPSSSSSSSC